MLLSNRIMFSITKRLTSQMNRLITQNIHKQFSSSVASPSLQEEHQCCGIGCVDCVLLTLNIEKVEEDRLEQLEQLEKVKKLQLDRFYQSINYTPNDFLSHNLYFRHYGNRNGYVK